MKRFLVVLLVILIVFPLCLGGLLWFTYSSTAESSIPMPKLTVLETALLPAGYEWHTPVFGGMVYKDFYQAPNAELQDLGQMTEPSLNAEVPGGFSSMAVLSKDGADVWSGQAENLSEYVFLDSGLYELRVDSRREMESGKGYGSLQYRAQFTAQVDIRLEQGADALAQGDVLAIRLYNLPEGAAPTAKGAQLPPIQFVPSGPGRMTAYVAAAHDTTPGIYNVQVGLDGRSWDVSFNVVETEFPIQELTVDNTDTQITNANSPAAYQEYNETIPPLFALADNTVYWQGQFLWPVEGELNTEYGLFRYTNGSKTPSRHPAIDIGAPKGTPVQAPAAGRVLFAAELANTGNTLVIEHGDGLKSLFYHMDSLSVAEGDMVERGQQVGTVGSTGYSTGPHLHYEVRLFQNSVNPMRLFDGTSGLYAFEDKESEAWEAPATQDAMGEAQSGAAQSDAPESAGAA